MVGRSPTLVGVVRSEARELLYFGALQGQWRVVPVGAGAGPCFRGVQSFRADIWPNRVCPIGTIHRRTRPLSRPSLNRSVDRVGDERSIPGQDSARHAPGPEMESNELNVPDVRFLLKTPEGVLAAQRLVGNRAVHGLLRLGPPTSAGGLGKGEVRPGAGIHEGALYASVAPPVAVWRDTAGTTVPQSGVGDQAVAGNAGDLAQPLDGGGGSVTYSYSKNSSSGGNFQFTDPDYNTLMATLTARMGREEIGRCFPNLTLVLNGINVPQNGSAVTVPDDSAPVKTGTFTVVDSITLPTWTNVGSAAVQDAQRAEWNRYTTAVAAHEDLHAADDKSTYDPVGTTLGQKKIGAAIDAVSAATTAANAKAGPRDASNPPPTLNPAGTTKVP